MSEFDSQKYRSYFQNYSESYWSIIAKSHPDAGSVYDYVAYADIKKTQPSSDSIQKWRFLQNRARYTQHLSKYFRAIEAEFDDRVFGNCQSDVIPLKMFKCDPNYTDKKSNVIPGLYYTLPYLLKSFAQNHSISEFTREVAYFYQNLPENLIILDSYLSHSFETYSDSEMDRNASISASEVSQHYRLKRLEWPCYS